MAKWLPFVALFLVVAGLVVFVGSLPGGFMPCAEVGRGDPRREAIADIVRHARRDGATRVSLDAWAEAIPDCRLRATYRYWIRMHYDVAEAIAAKDAAAAMLPKPPAAPLAKDRP